MVVLYAAFLTCFSFGLPCREEKAKLFRDQAEQLLSEDEGKVVKIALATFMKNKVSLYFSFILHVISSAITPVFCLPRPTCVPMQSC